MSPVYEIGPFRLDPAAGALTRAGVAVPLGGRAVGVLAALVERPNEYVPKAHILDAAWPGVVVEEANLAVQISSIRRALAQAPGGEHWIETLARRGYRFVGPVAVLGEAATEREPRVARLSNLPEPLTSFVGRERELVEIKRLLPKTRLLTLVGVGGIGKTRLALQAAAEVTGAYRDGVWLVDLAPLSDASLVTGAVARALDVRELPGKPLLETLCGQVRKRQLLLVLDNCEHVAAACMSVAEALLRGSAGLTIVATSRGALHAAGEQIYVVSALSLPGVGADLETLAGSEAVRLFVERAQKQQPEFTLTAARAPAVSQLCTQLDGIPLAIELATARLRALSIEQINARLDDRFRLLTDGAPSALPRQQTLRATLDWSHDLLTEPERVVLRRLAVFAGGFTLDAASAVAADEAVDATAVEDVLAQLVARSMVLADTSVAQARYGLLETMRAYAHEKLAAAGETRGMLRRHAEYFRGFFANAPSDWYRMSDADWHARYPREIDNVRAALDWALGAGDAPAIAIGLAGDSASLWMTLGLQREGARRMEAARARVAPETPETGRARLWLSLGTMYADAEPVRSIPPLEEAVARYREMADPLSLGDALFRLSHSLAVTGRVDRAEALLAESLPPLQISGSAKALNFYFMVHGWQRRMAGDLAAARSDIERSLSLARSAGAEITAAAMAGQLAELTWLLGDLDAGKAALIEAIAMARSTTIVRKRSLAVGLGNLAGLLTERGELDEALAIAREGVPLLRDAGLLWMLVDHFALRAGLASKLSGAARLAGFADAAHEAKAAVRQPLEARARDRLRAMLRTRLDPNELARLLDEGASLSEDDACRIALEG